MNQQQYEEARVKVKEYEKLTKDLTWLRHIYDKYNNKEQTCLLITLRNKNNWENIVSKDIFPEELQELIRQTILNYYDEEILSKEIDRANL